MDLAAVTQAVADSISDVFDGRVYNWPVQTASPPFATCVPDEFEPRIVYGGQPRLPITVRVLVGAPDVKSATAKIYDYMSNTGALSVMAALESDGTLGSVVDSVMVERIGQPSIFNFGGVDLLGFEITLDVITTS